MASGNRARAAAGSAVLAAALWWTSGAADLARPPAISDGEAARLWERAVAARDESRDADALAAVERLLASSPHEPRYLSFEAQSLELLARPLDAARAWELYAESAPFPTEACPSLGRDYSQAGLPDRALDADRRCLAMDPSKSDLMLFLALRLERSGADGEAAALVDQVLARAPDYGDALLARARILRRRGDVDGAEMIVKRLLAGNAAPSADLLLVDAMIALDRGRPADVPGLLAPAIKSSPGYADLYRVLLRAQQQLGDSAGAARTHEIILGLEHDQGSAR